MKEIDKLIGRIQRKTFKDAARKYYNECYDFGYNDEEILALMNGLSCLDDNGKQVNYNYLYKLWIEEFSKT